MLWRKLRTLIVQQWVGFIALFLVLATGTAYALPGSNTVFSDDIVNAEVTAADIGSGAVASDEIKNATIVANDVAPNALGGGKITDGSLAGVDVRDGGLTGGDVADNSLTGADVANDSLTGTDINEATLSGLDATDDFDDSCDPDTTAYIICGETTITLARTMNVLVIVTSHFRNFGTGLAEGNCHLEKNNALDSGNHVIGGDSEGSADKGGMNLVDVQTLVPGTYTFDVLCNQASGDIVYHNIRVAAVKLAQD